ncbi:MAG: hypothetical protein V1800_12710, partial [Candidatus Latescibacterota bacterium]
RTLCWALYPLGEKADYFTFINQVRRDWRTNFTVQGPYSFFDVVQHHDMLHDPQRLKAYLLRKRLKVVALGPWLDYDNLNARTGKLIDRETYRTMMREAATTLRTADAEIKCIGCMEGNIVSLPPEAVKALFELIPIDKRGQGDGIPFTDAQMAILKTLPLRWKDCLLTAPDGRSSYELYYRGALDPSGNLSAHDTRSVPMMAVLVYAAPANDQVAYWLDQARFMIEEVGLDGIYIDQFNLAFNARQRYSYEQWDGVTVDMDPGTGLIARRYTDGALVGTGARKELIEYVLGKGKVMVTNTCPAAKEVQAYPITRFMEAEFGAHVVEMREGEKPPLRYTPCEGHLASPVALGSRPERHGEAGVRTYARSIMRTVIDYLRHGVLFHHYLTEIPEMGQGSGEYGPINHMFPFTPVELHEGWVLGKERIISCVSMDTFWENEHEPVVFLFDLDGRERIPRDHFQFRKEGEQWHITLKLEDWQEIAVVETARCPDQGGHPKEATP